MEAGDFIKLIGRRRKWDPFYQIPRRTHVDQKTFCRQADDHAIMFARYVS